MIRVKRLLIICVLLFLPVKAFADGWDSPSGFDTGSDQQLATTDSPTFAGLTLTGPIIVPLGSAANPSVEFVDGSGDGFYAGATANMRVAIGGSDVSGWTSTVFFTPLEFYGVGTTTVNTNLDIWDNGTSTMQIDFNDVASSTSLVLWNRADNAMVRVTVGANSTGGTGFRALHIPNL